MQMVQIRDTGLVQMRTWELTIDPAERSRASPKPGDALAPSGEPEGLPLYRRIARTIAVDIERGRLRPGERLPSTRELAEQLGANRNTLVAAFDLLHSEGYVSGRSRSGTFVAERPPGPRAQPEPRAAPVGFELPPAVPARRPLARAPGTLLLLGGVPEIGFVPHRELARAYAKAARGRPGRRRLDYAPPEGAEPLRVALGEMLARTRGLRAPPESICVVRGSQQGLYLAARALVRPGELVAVEDPGYPPIREVMRRVGAELAPIPVDGDGLDTAALAALCARRTVRAVALTPHHQCPTTVALSPERRRALLSLAEAHRMMVLEDDYDYDFHYDGPPVLPLAASDRAGVVVYVATMSKTLAPGLRLGYVAAPPAVIERIAAYRLCVDQQGDHLVEHAVATLLEDGVIQRHARRARRLYRLRRDALCEALGAHLPGLTFAVPSGGMALWARAPGVDTDALAERALAAGVAIQSGRRFRLDEGPSEHLRLGFAACAEPELREAVRRLASCG